MPSLGQPCSLLWRMRAMCATDAPHCAPASCWQLISAAITLSTRMQPVLHKLLWLLSFVLWGFLQYDDSLPRR